MAPGRGCGCEAWENRVHAAPSTYNWFTGNEGMGTTVVSGFSKGLLQGYLPYSFLSRGESRVCERFWASLSGCLFGSMAASLLGRLAVATIEEKGASGRLKSTDIS